LEQLKLNIRETVGVPFELIAIDNNIEKKSIAAVYNAKAGDAKFNCLCFLHEDVIIHSNDWGKVLIELLSDEKIGLVGVSGAVYKSKYAATWSACDKSLYRTHSIQHFKNSSASIETSINPDNDSFSEVVVIDGVFMATTKKVFSQFRFDEVLLTGFHGYDIDYSLLVSSKYKIVVSYEILLEHLSEGQLNKEWLDNSITLHNKWKKRLPAQVKILKKSIIQFSDSLACGLIVRVATKHKGYKLMVIKTYFKLLFIYFRFNRMKHTKLVAEYLLSFR